MGRLKDALLIVQRAPRLRYGSITNPIRRWSRLARAFAGHAPRSGGVPDYGTRAYKDRQAELDAMGFDLATSQEEVGGGRIWRISDYKRPYWGPSVPQDFVVPSRQ
jgi:hypothetical protein